MKFFKKVLIIIALSCVGIGGECYPPLLTVGGGFFEGGERHSGGLFQIEYKFSKCCFWHVRPMINLMTPEFCSLYAGMGLGVEIKATEHFLIIPNFMPGVYFKGSGRDLGYPIEFRSCIDLAYEWESCFRFGFQFFHISNASLSNRNPGANGYLFYMGIPLAH